MIHINYRKHMQIHAKPIPGKPNRHMFYVALKDSSEGHLARAIGCQWDRHHNLWTVTSIRTLAAMTDCMSQSCKMAILKQAGVYLTVRTVDEELTLLFKEKASK